jgi:hypothetical protein
MRIAQRYEKMLISYNMNVAGLDKDSAERKKQSARTPHRKDLSVVEFYQNVLRVGASYTIGIMGDDKWIDVARIGESNEYGPYKPYGDRRVKENTRGFSILGADVDSERLTTTNEYAPTFIERNLENYKSIPGLVIIQNSSSYGKITTNPAFDNGIKEGKHLIVAFGQTITATMIQNAFTKDEYDVLVPQPSVGHVCEDEYLLPCDQWVKTHMLAREAVALEMMMNQMLFVYLKKMGLMEQDFNIISTTGDGNRAKVKSKCAVDPASFLISQVMYGGLNAPEPLFYQPQNVLSFSDTIKLFNECVAELKKMAVRGPTPNNTPTRKVRDGGRVYVYPTYTNKDINPCKDSDRALLNAALDFIPKRVPGTSTYHQYFKLATALKFCGFQPNDVSEYISDDILSSWDGLKSHIRDNNGDVDAAGNVRWAMKILKEMSNNFQPSFEHVVPYGFTQTVNEKYVNGRAIRTLINQYDCVTVKSTMGTGKTTTVAELAIAFPGMQILFVAHRKKLLESAAGDAKFVYYEDSENVANEKRLCITWQSLHKLEDADFSNTIFVCEEHTQTFKSIASERHTLKNLQLMKSIKVFHRLGKEAKKVLLLDADDVYGVIDFLPNRTHALYKNTYCESKMHLQVVKWDDNKKEYEKRQSDKKRPTSMWDLARDDILNSLLDGEKVAIPIAHRKLGREFDEFFKSKGFTGHIISATSRDDEEGNSLIEGIKNRTLKYDYIIMTPAAWTGVDFSKKCHEISRTVAVFPMVPGIGAKDRAQAVCRFREVPECTVYGVWSTNTELISEKKYKSSRQAIENRYMKNMNFETAAPLIADPEIDRVIERSGWMNHVCQNYCPLELFVNNNSFDFDCTEDIIYVNNAHRCHKESREHMVAVRTEIKDIDAAVACESAIVSGIDLELLKVSDLTNKTEIILKKSLLAASIGHDTTMKICSAVSLPKATAASKILPYHMLKDAVSFTDFQNYVKGNVIVSERKYALGTAPSPAVQFDMNTFVPPSAFARDFDKQKIIALEIHDILKTIDMNARFKRDSLKALYEKFLPIFDKATCKTIQMRHDAKDVNPIYEQKAENPVDYVDDLDDVDDDDIYDDEDDEDEYVPKRKFAKSGRVAKDIDGNEKIVSYVDLSNEDDSDIKVYKQQTNIWLGVIRAMIKRVGYEFKSKKVKLPVAEGGNGVTNVSCWKFTVNPAVQMLVDDGVPALLLERWAPKIVSFTTSTPFSIPGWNVVPEPLCAVS